MTLEKAKQELEKFVQLKTTLRPAFVDVLLNAEEVKHGHWTDRAQSILGVPTEACSECAEWSIGYNKDYCPCCGAKMDEVKNGKTN